MQPQVSKADELFRRGHEQWERGRLRSAFLLFLAAAKRGDTGAQVNLGYFYDVGIGTRPNRNAALLWYRKAYRAGERTAASNIATIFRDEKKLNKSISWFQRAVELGDGDANLELAKIYLRDKKDIRRAALYLKETCRARVKDVTASSKEEAKRLLRLVRVKAARTRSA